MLSKTQESIVSVCDELKRVLLAGKLGPADPEKVEQVCEQLKIHLLEKNKRYGDSALSPIQVFGKHRSGDSGDVLGNILTRLDDKLSRIRNAEALRMNDVVETAGYLMLACIAVDWLDFSSLLD